MEIPASHLARPSPSRRPSCGAHALEGFLGPREITAKGHNDFFTEIDLAAEDAICRR